jgi:hypothetical protein
MRRYRLRGLSNVAAEFALATTALNLTRLWRMLPPLRCTIKRKPTAVGPASFGNPAELPRELPWSRSVATLPHRLFSP